MLGTTLRTVLTVTVTLLLVYLSTAPRSMLRQIPFIGDASKYEQHVMAAFLLSLILWWWLAKRLRGWAVLAVFGLSIAVASAVEMVQWFIPHRGSSVNDLKPALVGSAAGVLAALFMSWFRKRIGGIGK